MSRHLFADLAESMARRITKVTPCARSDPFFARRLLTHFMLGVENPQHYVKHVRAVEDRLQRARALASAEGKGGKAPTSAAATVAAQKRAAPRKRKPYVRKTTQAGASA